MCTSSRRSFYFYPSFGCTIDNVLTLLLAEPVKPDRSELEEAALAACIEFFTNAKQYWLFIEAITANTAIAFATFDIDLRGAYDLVSGAFGPEPFGQLLPDFCDEMVRRLTAFSAGEKLCADYLRDLRDGFEQLARYHFSATSPGPSCR